MLLSMVGRGISVIGLGEMVMILDLHRQGLSVSAIARASGADRKTVRKYIERGLETPVYGPRQPRQGAPRRALVNAAAARLRHPASIAAHSGGPLPICNWTEAEPSGYAPL